MASLVRMNKGESEISIQDINEYTSEKFKGYDLIAFYPMVASLSKMTEMSDKIKKDNPNSKICFFNSDQHQHEMLLCNPTAKEFGIKMMEKHSSIDYVLVGEAEKSFIDLCDKLNNKKDNFENLASCLYRKEGKIQISKNSIKPVDFKYLPFQSRDFLETTISSEGINLSSPRIQSSRGCVSGCYYCTESSANITPGGRKIPLLMRDIDKFVDEIELLYQNYGVVFFNVIDSSFEGSGSAGIRRMSQFFDEIKERNIQASFKVHLRAETVKKLDDLYLDNLKESGVDIIGLGPESCLEKELKSYKKIATIEESVNSMQRLRKEDKFFVIPGYIMFTPILELDDLPKKLDFLKKIGYGWDYLNLANNILVFPGTKYHEFLKSKDLVVETAELAPLIKYKFEDSRVEDVAKAINNLKIICPETIKTHNLIYDSMNIVSRFKNKMNKHLKQNEKAFYDFKASLDKILNEVQETYSSFFMNSIDLARAGMQERKLDLITQDITNKFPAFMKRTDDNIKKFISDCEDKNLSTSKLYLKTWMSLVYTQENTTGGKINGK